MQGISLRSLYNRLQWQEKNTYLLIDTRALAEVLSEGNLLTAILLPPPSNAATCTLADLDSDQKFFPFQPHFHSFQNRKSKDIIFYQQSEWTTALAKLINEENCVFSIKFLTESLLHAKAKFPVIFSKHYFYSNDRMLLKKNEPTSRQFPNAIDDEGGLFLGCSNDATEDDVVQALSFTHILNCNFNLEDYKYIKSGIKYYDLKIDKRSMETSTDKAFDEAYSFIQHAKRSLNSRILLHSSAGRSICCSLAVYYMMKSKNMSLLDSYNHVLENRPRMRPREGIVSILLQKEEFLFKTSSIKPEQIRELIRGEFLHRKEAPRPSIRVSSVAMLQSCSALNIQSLEDSVQIEKYSEQPSTIAEKEQIVKRNVGTEVVSCSWLFNQLQTIRGMILIDARPVEDYNEDTIPFAICVAPIPSNDMPITLSHVEKELLPEQRSSFTYKKRKLQSVVIFGDVDKKNESNKENSWVRKLGNMLVDEGAVTRVKYLDDGFTTFRFRYPFYTTSFDFSNVAKDDTHSLMRTPSGTHSVNYPNEILDNFLYLGNMWHAQSQNVIKNLGITHIVNASLDIANTFADTVSYLEVKLKDKVDANIMQFFNPTFKFIEKAKKQPNCRVLVHCTQGVSRSSTLVIYYLMRSHQWSLVTSVNFTLNNRGVAFPNEGFLMQLLEAENLLYKGNSLQASEFDLLLQQMIADRPVPIGRASFISQNCGVCEKRFSVFEWTHRCTYCMKSVCKKCSIKILGENVGCTDLNASSHRICDNCLLRLWIINLPCQSKLRRRALLTRSICVNNFMTYGRPVWITFFEGTEEQLLMQVLYKRFSVKLNEIVHLTAENGEEIANLTHLSDQSAVYISLGKAGKMKCVPKAECESDEGEITVSRKLNVSHESSHKEIDLEEETAQAEPSSFNSREENFMRLWQTCFPRSKCANPKEILKINDPDLVADIMLGVCCVSNGVKDIESFSLELSCMNFSEQKRKYIIDFLNRTV